MGKSVVLLFLLLCFAAAQLESNPKGFILTSNLAATQIGCSSST